MAVNLNALVLKIGADASGVTHAAKVARRDVGTINGIFRRQTTAADRARNATDALNRIHKAGAVTNREYARGLDAIRAEYGTVGRAATRYHRITQRIKTTTATMRGGLVRAAGSMRTLVAAGAGLVGVAASARSIHESMQGIDALAKTADKLGVSTEALSALRFAAEETSGMLDGQFDTALQRMVRRTAEAAQGTGEAKNAIAELGLNAQRLGQLSPDKQFAAYADAFERVNNQSDRLRLAFKLFDSEGVGLINMLKIGSRGLDEYRREAERLGLTINRFDASQIEKANDAFGRIGKVVDGVKNRIAIGLAPVVESVSQSFTQWSVNADRSSSRIHTMIERLGKGVGFVANGIDLWRRVFVSTRAYVSEFLSWMAERTERAANQMIRTMNRIPGVKAEIDPFIGNFADEMGREAEKARKQANEAWNRPLPSDKIDKYFKTLNANVAKSRKEFEKAAELREKMKNAETSGLFNFDLGGLVNRASQTIQKLAKDMQISAVQTVRLEAPPSAEKGSRDLYRLIADSQRRNLDQMKPAKINIENTKDGRAIALAEAQKTAMDSAVELMREQVEETRNLNETIQGLELGEGV